MAVVSQYQYAASVITISPSHTQQVNLKKHSSQFFKYFNVSYHTATAADGNMLCVEENVNKQAKIFFGEEQKYRNT